MTAADTPHLPDQAEGAGPDRRALLLGISAMGLAAFAAPLALDSNAAAVTAEGAAQGPKPTPKPDPKKKAAAKKKAAPKKKAGAKKGAKAAKGGKPVKDGDTPLTDASAIPVNSGMLFEADDYIITQPTAGKYVGFSSLCTHEGCPVDVFDRPGIMACSCHSTDFKITDGSVISGPARKPMPMKPIVVEGGKIYKAKKA